MIAVITSSSSSSSSSSSPTPKSAASRVSGSLCVQPHELQANLLLSQQIKEIYAPSAVELKDPTIIEVRDTALEAVKESEADSKSLDYMARFWSFRHRPESAALKTFSSFVGPGIQSNAR